MEEVKKDEIAKSLIVPVVIGTCIVVAIATIGRIMTEKKSQ